IVEMFIKHVLGVNSDDPGFYGETSAYYGTVEQQGRLTLHLHMMIWIANTFSPQEIRDKLMAKDSAFQASIIAYLEACFQGELATGSLDNVRDSTAEKMKQAEENALAGEKKEDTYADPTETLPIPPPEIIHCTCDVIDDPINFEKCDESSHCSNCVSRKSWWTNIFYPIADDIISRANVHGYCRASLKPGQKRTASEGDDTEDAMAQPKGRLDRNGICRARFPRDIHTETTVDEDGHINLKKLEPLMNTFSHIVSYLTRSNTDVSTLLSGTAVKAIVSYVTDYITKPALKSYQIFSTAYDIYQKNTSLITDTDDTANGARKVLLKMANSISSKLEIGSPMAAMYLLGNPDHYTGHQFVPFWWKNYIAHLTKTHSVDQQAADGQDDDEFCEKVLLTKSNGKYVGWSNIDDYIHRPDEYQDVSLYEWIQCSIKSKSPRKGKKSKKATVTDEAADEGGFASDSPSEASSDEEDLKNLPASEPKKGYFNYRKGHCQYNSHCVKVDFERKETHVPNFLGGSLPRKDHGDYQYFCQTMLAFFKPWRSHTDLKETTSNWEEAFLSHEFNDYNKKLMANFNLRYECLDERDDYHAIMKKKEAECKRNGTWVGYDNDDDEEDYD
ncbi:hypothetical protein DFP72DRAFT_761944, partial [Ephemerocybe angulata]